jgi:hypothetical protein
LGNVGFLYNRREKKNEILLIFICNVALWYENVETAFQEEVTKTLDGAYKVRSRL